MSNGARCGCGCCTTRAMMWPAFLIALGLLFLIDRFHIGYGFHNLWPVLLIVVGVVKVAAAMASPAGHTGN